MKLSWIDIVLILFGLFLAYQLLRAIFGGTWQTESLIIAFLVFNFGLLWKLNMSLLKLNMKFEGYVNWHKTKDKFEK